MPSTQTTPSIRFHGLDTLRAAAIVIVMLYHLYLQDMVPPILHRIARVGWVGVDLFFVLSGFLIASQLFRPYLTGGRPSLSDFYTRRAYRILPAFLVVWLLYLILPIWREAPGLYAAWQYVTFTWNLLLLGYPENHAFSHVWSLCVEEHFYLLFPVLLIILMRKPSAWRTASVLLFILFGGIALRTWLLRTVIQPSDEQGLTQMKYIYYPTYSRLDGLAVGVSLAIVRTFKVPFWTRLSRHSGAMALLGVACVIGALQLCGFDHARASRPLSIVLTFPILSCGFGLLVASAVCEKSLLRVRVPGASALAGLAYSLYLTHKSVAHAAHEWWPVLTARATWLSFAIYMLACLCVAWLLHRGVERPMMGLHARRTLKKVVLGFGSEAPSQPES